MKLFILSLQQKKTGDEREVFTQHNSDSVAFSNEKKTFFLPTIKDYIEDMDNGHVTQFERFP